MIEITTEGRHNAFGGLAYHNGEFVCSYRHGASHSSADGELRTRTSVDGVVWSEPAVLYDGPIDSNSSTLTLDNGRLWCAGGRRYSSQYAGSFLYRRGGSGWVGSLPLDGFHHQSFGAGGVYPIDGSIIMPVWGFDTGNGYWSGSYMDVRLVRSDDDGISWRPVGIVADGKTTNLQYNETGLVLSDGVLWAIVREERNRRLMVTQSTDFGGSWSTPTLLVGNAGAMPNPTKLSDGSVVWLYRDWGDPSVMKIAQASSDFSTVETVGELGRSLGGSLGVYGQVVEVSGGVFAAYGIESGVSSMWFEQLSLLSDAPGPPDPPSEPTTIEVSSEPLVFDGVSPAVLALNESEDDLLVEG